MAGECSRTKQSVSVVPMKKSLIDEIFSVSLDDIFNEEFFKAKVKKIPESFQGVKQYFKSFIYPLLEDIRAELCFSLENISRAPYSEVTTLDSSKQNTTFLYDIKVDYWRNRFGIHGQEESYRTLPGDIFAFIGAKPEAVSDMQLLEWVSLAEITEHKNGDDDNGTGFQVKASKEIEVKLLSGKPLFVVFLMNIRTNERIWNSLQMAGNMTLFKQILCSSNQDQDERNCGLCSARGNCSVSEDSIRPLSSELNESQRKVIADVLQKIQCNHRSFVELIWGPPGSGKTKTLSILLFILLRMKCRVLICAPTDVATARVASSVLKLVKESSEASISLSRIIYFGDNGISSVNADIHDIYLDHPVKSQDNCLRITRASLIFCTASSSYILHSMLADSPSLLIIDEAAQLKECESIIPLQLPSVRNTVLFGDQFQLSATVTSNESARAGFGRSLFERLISIGLPKHILNMQYRMHPFISLLPNSEFYGNQNFDAPNVRNKSYAKCFLPGPMFGPYSFINVSCGIEEINSFRYSFKNMVEVAIVMKLVRKLFKEWNKSKQKLSIGILSPYTAQVVAIKEKVGLGHKYENLDGFSLKVNTIDEFQGGEEDVIVLSTVRSNSDRSVRHSFNQQSTNLALTRAKCCLWIVGDGNTLSEINSVWKLIVRDAKNRQCYYDAEEDEELANVVLEVKQELDQFDDILNADSILFKNARWKVLVSDNFRKSLEKLKSSETKKLVINLLLRLSCGWRPKRRNLNFISDNFSEILKQFKVKNQYIICSVDIVKDSFYIQALKVWDILPLEDIPQLVNHLNPIFRSYSQDFIDRCKKKCLEGDLEIPMRWCSHVARYKKDLFRSGNDSSICVSDELDFVESCKASDSLLLMKFYSLSSGAVSHLLSGCDGNEVDIPFELTDEEMDIIHFCRSSFILGRSGTGKTTVLIMKLFQKEQLYHLASEGFHEVESNVSCGSEVEKEGNILRQIFVTVNVRLCYAVSEYISRLKRSICGWISKAENSQVQLEDFDEASLFSDIPDSFTDLPPMSYPLVITFNKFLMMLNGSVGRSFFERFLEIRGLLQGRRKGTSSMTLKAFIRTKEVHYDKFCSSYWLHFSQHLTKKLDPSTVFAEIISHVKGGSRVGVNDDIMSREDYISYSKRRLSHLSEQERSRIYDIFLEYEKKKKTRGEYDLSDLVIDLHYRLRNETYEGEKMDFVYIDEVQDLTLRQISLFKYICRNFEEGFVFSGDTAQTIARGVDFRFEDIRALFYKEFCACERKGKGKISDKFHLRQNFRTHAGNLKLANSVLELLYHFFPFSLDKLQPETSLLNGEQPVWVQMRNGENALGLFLECNGNNEHGIVGFGAEQVILVRDEGVRNDVMNHLGKQALVLTIMECKGLEFQDVLLYNFFSSSPLKDQWDVIYGYMQDQDLLKSPHLKSFPSFNEGKHIALCSELKQLYVAITRTRERLWIFESKCCSMYDYWEKLFLIKIRQVDNKFMQEIQVPSSSEEWKSRAMMFFYQQNYDKAKFCFGKAGESYWEKLAEAGSLRCTADRMSDSNIRTARTYLSEAARIYDSIGKYESAVQCLFELKEYEKAGMMYLEKFDESKLEEAGECFYLAGCYKRAAQIYAKCSLFSKFLSVCVDGKLFEMGHQYIRLWRENNFVVGQEFLESQAVQRFYEKGAHQFNKLNDSNSMMIFVNSFQSKDLMRTFLKSIDCLDRLVLLEKEWGNFFEAAQFANMKGDVLLAVDLLEMAGRFVEASKALLSYVFYNSLWTYGCKGWPLKQFADKEELLRKAKTFAKNVSDEFYEFICIEAKILTHEHDNLYNLNNCWDSSWRHGSVRGKLLCARKIFDKISQYEWMYWVADVTNYSKQKISYEQTSVQRMVYYCTFWEEEIEKIFEHVQDYSNEDSYSEFCMNYFGVKKQLKNEKSMYLLLCPDAAWIRDINLYSAKRNGNIWVDAGQFVHGVKSFWSSEIFSVCVKALGILEALYAFSANNALSFNFKKMLLTEIFKVSKILIESKVLNHRELTISIGNFFGRFYPLDWRKPLTEDMINLRGSGLSRNLLNEVINRIINSRIIRSEEIGMLVTILLSGKFSPDLYEKTATSFGNSKSWTSFILSLGRTIRPVILNNSMINVALVQNFHEALEDTQYTDFSPSCFLYLVERLLIMVSNLKGYFFTTKSSLVEWLISEGWNTNPNLKFVSDVQESLEKIVYFVACIVEEILSEEQAAIQWIKKYNLKLNSYLLLVLRLFVILCLLCINFRVRVHSDLLFNLLGRRELTSLLPWKFYESLQKLKEHGKEETNIEVIAEALEMIGNPLVIVNRGVEFSVPGAVFLNLNVLQDRKRILKALYLKNYLVSSNKTHPSKQGRVESCSRELSLKINDRETLPTSCFVSIPDKKTFAQNGNAVSEAQQSNLNFWLILGSVDFQNKRNFISDATLLKDVLLEYILLVNAAVRKCSQSKQCYEHSFEVNNVLDELQQLYSALDASKWGDFDIKTVQDLVKKLECRREQMEPLIDKLTDI